MIRTVRYFPMGFNRCGRGERGGMKRVLGWLAFFAWLTFMGALIGVLIAILEEVAKS